ncbi:MAG: hypothetical protein LUE96_01325 [Lachnospiraceae bacterium]|nr:hypothetical protein [Lachnospiraceae bacterium]
MKKRIVGYRKKIDALLEEMPAGTDWDSVLKEHLIQVSFFQHERLIHLIVTVTFGILTMLALAVYCIAEYMPILLLIALFLVLLIPYIGHYYVLENEVQRMYGQYDRLQSIAGSQIHKVTKISELP